MMEWKTLLNKERRRKSTMAADHRAEFERDWDRTIFSTPVKRLQDKTQVFPLDPNDAVRTRLTHSLEVSSVARGMAIKASQWLLSEKKIEAGMDRAMEAIASTCGLVHDIGNPPFGHSGEDAIRYWFANRFPITKDKDGKDVDPLLPLLGNKQQLVSDFRLFEGNAQALRLLTKLQILADFYGLNLTYGTLSASCKYVAASTEVQKNGNHACSKPGYFASETDVVKDIRDRTGTGSARNPITFLVEAADDAVYSVADIEDAVRSVFSHGKKSTIYLAIQTRQSETPGCVQTIYSKLAVMNIRRDCLAISTRPHFALAQSALLSKLRLRRSRRTTMRS